MDESVALANEGVQAGDRAERGLTVLTTCVFVVGVIAGSGFLALPKAVENAGWIGFVIIFVCCFAAAYTGKVLGNVWVIVRERYPEFRTGHTRYPYPAMGQVAFGKVGRILVSFCINFTMFGSTVVYLLLASDNIYQLLHNGTDFSLCYICLIVGGVLIPVTWFGTPKEFWGIAAGATLATGIASLLMLANIIWHGDAPSDVKHDDVKFESFFMAFGTISFAYGGHPAFPTFQADMKDQSKFWKACFLGYIIVMFMYLPTSLAAYFMYGSKVMPNILATVPKGPLSTIVSILMTAHLVFGTVIIINPVCQELEHFVKIPEEFTWKRVVCRTILMGSAIFTAESVPHFSSILALVGGSTVTALVYVFPPLFYIRLCTMKPKAGDKPWAQVHMPLHSKVFQLEIILIGTIAGVAATYSAIQNLAVNRFTVPCYVNATVHL